MELSKIINEAAKIRYRSGGSFNAGGLTIRTPTMSVVRTQFLSPTNLSRHPGTWRIISFSVSRGIFHGCLGSEGMHHACLVLLVSYQRYR